MLNLKPFLFFLSVIEIVYKDKKFKLSDAPIKITREDLEAVNEQWKTLSDKDKKDTFRTYWKLNKLNEGINMRFLYFIS